MSATSSAEGIGPEATAAGEGSVSVRDRHLPSAAGSRLGLSEQQKALRATGLGASEVPTALGLNPWKSAAELAAEKRGELEPTEAGEAALWGQRFERPIAEEFITRRRAEGLALSIFTPPTLRHPTSPILMATCDRVIVPEGRRARSEWLAELEIKNLSMYRREEFGDAADDIPEPILVQVQVQLEVIGLEDAWLAVVLGGQSYQERPLKRDREMGGQLAAFVEEWWADHVVQGLACPVDGSDASSAYLRRRFPSNLGPAIDPTADLVELVEAARDAKTLLREAEAGESEAINALKAAIGEAEGITGLCTWKSNKPSRKTDWEAVAGALHPPPDLVTLHTANRPGARVLRFATTKE